MSEIISLVKCGVQHDCGLKRSKKCAVCEIGFNYIAEEPLQLTCGHVICENCKTRNKITCSEHGETVVGMDSIASKFILNDHQDEIIKDFCEKYDNALDLLNETEVNFEINVNQKVDEIKGQIIEKVDTLKATIDNLKIKLFENLDDIKNNLLKKFNNNNIKCEKLSTLDKKLSLNNLYEYQKKMRDVIQQIQNYFDISYKIRFAESDIELNNIQPIGLIEFHCDDFRLSKWHYNFDKNQNISSTKNSHLYDNDATYEGELKDGKKHGNGILIFEDNEKYEGAFLNDVRSGRGKYFFSNGDIYDGEWRNDQMNGYGKYIYAHNDDLRRKEYDGEWIDGKRSGYGFLTWKEGHEYFGEFNEDRRHGNGILKSTNGEYYNGEWFEDLFHGIGRYYYAKQDEEKRYKYDGEFQNGLKNGTGAEYYLNGDKYEGKWLEDKKHGRGALYTDKSTGCLTKFYLNDIEIKCLSQAKI